MPRPVDILLYNKVKKVADLRFPKPSAYKSAWIVRTYKNHGGRYTGAKGDELDEAIEKIKSGGYI